MYTLIKILGFFPVIISFIWLFIIFKRKEQKRNPTLEFIAVCIYAMIMILQLLYCWNLGTVN